MTPEQRKCWSALHNALDNGKIVRPDVCDNCGQPGIIAKDGRSTIQAHHSDYSKPLQVEWLCVKCHSKTIFRNREKMRSSHLGKKLPELVKFQISESLKQHFFENPKIAPTGRPWVRFGVPRRTWYRWKDENKLGCRLIAFLVKKSKFSKS